jgi:hypothetical protein
MSFPVIPAKAGIQPQSRVRGDMTLFRASPGISWIPAFAGMTGCLWMDLEDFGDE